MSEAEFSNVMFYWSLRETGRQNEYEKQVNVCRLFNEDGSPNQAVKEAILQTCHLPKDSLVYKAGGERAPFASSEQIDQFFKEAKQLPPSQQYVFITTDHLRRTDPTIEKLTIMEGVRLGASFNFFDQFISRGDQQHGFPEGRKLEMLGSLGVYQVMGKVLFGEDCVSIRPTIGVSTTEEIQENGRTDERDLGLPFPGVELPKTADLLSCKTPEEFIRHDLYHFWLTSIVPSKHRKAIEAISQVVKEIIEDPQLSEDCQEYLNEVYERLIDMEFGEYRHDIGALTKDSAVKFVVCLQAIINRAVGRTFGKQRFNFLTGPRSEQEVFVKMTTMFAKEKVLQRIAEKLYDQREQFKREFSIDLFNQEKLSKSYEVTVDGERMNSSAPLMYRLWGVKPLMKWFGPYAYSQSSLPEALMKFRAQKQFASQLEDLHIH